MANSILTYSGAAGFGPYTVNFTLGNLKREYVKLRVNSEVDGLNEPLYRDIDWVSDSLVNITSGTLPTVADQVQLIRTIPEDVLQHDYSGGAVIDETNLDESNLQTIMLIHQFLDGRITSAFQAPLDMGSFKIINLADGTDAADAVNFGQISPIIDSIADIDAAVVTVEAAAASAAADAATAVQAAQDALDAAGSVIAPSEITPASEAADTSCFLAFINSAAATAQQVKYNSGLTYNPTTGALGATSFTGNAATATSATSATTAGSATTATSATALATGRTISISGDMAYTSPAFDGSGNVIAAGTLATVNSNVGSFTNASVTVDAKGRITAVSTGTAGYDPTTSFDQIYDLHYAVVSQTTAALIASEVYADMTGTGANVDFSPTITNNGRGIATCATGTQSTGRGGVYAFCSSTGAGAVSNTGTGAFIAEARAKITTLSDGTNRFKVGIGCSQTVFSIFSIDGIYFRYSDNVNSGKWEAVTSNGTETAVDTGVTATTSYALFRIEVNAANTSVTFYINNTLVATIATTIPSSALNVGAGLLKSVGTTERTIEVDYLRLKCTTR